MWVLESLSCSNQRLRYETWIPAFAGTIGIRVHHSASRSRTAAQIASATASCGW